MSVRILPPWNGRGPRIEVMGRPGLTISEATDLYHKLGEALLVIAKRHGEIDPRINEDKEIW